MKTQEQWLSEVKEALPSTLEMCKEANLAYNDLLEEAVKLKAVKNIYHLLSKIWYELPDNVMYSIHNERFRKLVALVELEEEDLDIILDNKKPTISLKSTEKWVEDKRVFSPLPIEQYPIDPKIQHP